MNYSPVRRALSRSAIAGLMLMVISSAPGVLARKVITCTRPELRLEWYRKHVQMKEQSWFKNIRWQFLGPLNISGRMTDVAVVRPKGKYYTIYVAGASGGVWKTENEGTTWQPVFEQAPSVSIGDIAISPSDQNIVWVGTGEANIFRSSMAGAGVFKSPDGGKTWSHMGLAATQTISRIVIHPLDPECVYVAASGHEWTDNPERGVYKTTDGGKSWNQVLFVDEKTGGIDLVMDPGNVNCLYAATWQRKRKKWNDPRNEADSHGSGIYKTVDGGKNWTAINRGLPAAEYRGRIGIDIATSNPNILYAFVDNYEVVGEWTESEVDSYGRPKEGIIRGATVYRSDDRGENWRQVSQDNEIMRNLSATYGWVFGQIRIDPNHEDRIYVMGLELNVSDDGGKTFRELRGMHGDHHGLWIDPDNSDYLVNVNDGGVAISYDRGKNWRTFSDNLPLVQFFNVSYDMDSPFHVYGSIQDHGSFRGKVDLSQGRIKIPAVKWEPAPGGEGSSHAIDPVDHHVVYSAGFYGSLTRTDLRTGEEKDILPEPGPGEEKLRGQWLAPFILSPHNPLIIYHGMNCLFRSLNRGDAWEKISPDLTYNEKDKMGDIPFHTIFSISESPIKFGLIYVGTDDGRVHVTRDGGMNWVEITDALPYRKWVSRIVASAYDLGTVYLAQNGKRDDDFSAYLWKSTNFGKNWKNLTHNIPSGPINVIREDPVNRNVLYVGTDLGVYVSIDGGEHWHTLAKDFPTTYVHDLIIHPRDNIMVCATHGRGMYAMDVRPIQQLTAEIRNKQAYLFDIDDARLPKWRWWRWVGGQQAVITYFLKDHADIKLEIKDSDGNTVKDIKGTADHGLNVAVWDLSGLPDVNSAAGNEKKIYVEPGVYTVVLTLGSFTEEKPVRVSR
jgi:photosystem II stability/assembly factor-like uncharacterized protein